MFSVPGVAKVIADVLNSVNRWALHNAPIFQSTSGIRECAILTLWEKSLKSASYRLHYSRLNIAFNTKQWQCTCTCHSPNCAVSLINEQASHTPNTFSGVLEMWHTVFSPTSYFPSFQCPLTCFVILCQWLWFRVTRPLSLPVMIL